MDDSDVEDILHSQKDILEESEWVPALEDQVSWDKYYTSCNTRDYSR